MFSIILWDVVKDIEAAEFDIDVGVFTFQFIKKIKTINLLMNGALIGKIPSKDDTLHIVNFDNVVVEDLAEAVVLLERACLEFCKDFRLLAVNHFGVKPVARVLQVSPKTVRQARDAGDCTRIGISKSICLSNQELLNALTANQ